MYWWHLVNVDKSELIQKFFTAQKLNKSKGDWIYQLEQDKKDLDMDLSDVDITYYSEDQFRKVVKSRTERFFANNLEKLRESHTKTENLKFSVFKPASYILSTNLTTEEVQTLFKLRMRMINVKTNFGSSDDGGAGFATCLVRLSNIC